MADDPAPNPVPPTYPLEFRSIVVRELETVGLGLKGWRDGGIDVEREDGSEFFVSLANLYQQVSAAPPESAAEMVRVFCRHATVGHPEEVAALPNTMEEAADRLMVRIGLPSEDGTNAAWPVPGVEDLSVHLVIDFPNMVAYVPAAMIGKSETPPQEWLYRGLDQLTARTPQDWLRLTHPDEGIFCGHADDSYDAARALVLCELTNSDDLGWLVTIPTRDWLFARKVEPAGLSYFHLLKVIATQAKAEQPHPLTDEVFWVRPGKPWERFRIDITEDKITVYPPAEFAAALDLKMEPEPESETP